MNRGPLFSAPIVGGHLAPLEIRSAPKVARYTLLAVVDDVTTCDCCGKRDLKCTMALAEHDADGNTIGEVYFGRDCGARALRWSVTADRAEKLARGTLTLRGDDSYAVYTAWHRHAARDLDAVYSGIPATTTIGGGVAVEVWSTFYGAAPAGRPWSICGRFLWRMK